jgi:hypothetical protein
MKKFYQIIASVGFSIIAIGAFSQNLGTMNRTPVSVKGLPTHYLNDKITDRPASGGTYAFLDYPFYDSVSYSPNYAGSPKLGQFYIMEMNGHYVAADTGAKATNTLLLHSCSVSFDTIPGMALAGVGSLMVDSLFIPIGQSNASGKKDTLIINITNLGAAGAPGATVLWRDTIINDTGLSGKGKSWFYGYTVVLAPHLAIAGNTFGVTMTYYDESKKDTFGFLYGYPTYSCTTPAGPLPDTSKWGMKIVPKLTANSFTNGYGYYTAAGHKGAPITLPAVAYGGAGGFGYACTTPANTSALPFQDIAMFALVDYKNITGIDQVAANGFSVSQNYPNPFNKNTNITYSLTKESDVVFSVYDMTGRKLVENTYGNVSGGQHVISLSANQFTPGVYFYTFKANGNIVTKRMVITE